MQEYAGTTVPFADLRTEEGSLSLIMAFGKQAALESENEALRLEKQQIEADCMLLEQELNLPVPDRKRKRSEDSATKPNGHPKDPKNRKFM